MRYFGAVILLHACHSLAPLPDETPANCAESSSLASQLLALNSTFESASLDVFNLACLSKPRRHVVVASGDSALRKLGEWAVILNRGFESNLQILEDDFSAGVQIALPGCGPHDALLLSETQQILVSCYAAAELRLVDLSGREQRRISLSAFADADGIPEADQLLRIEDRIWVSLQRLSADAEPVNTSLLIALDAHSLEVLGEPIELALKNPFTPMQSTNGLILIGCAGDFVSPSLMGLVQVNLETRHSSVVVDGRALARAPLALRVNALGEPHLLIAHPDGFNTQQMRLVRVDQGFVETRHSSQGFTLSGLAFEAEGNAFLGNRSLDQQAGLWKISAQGEVSGPYKTGLPPLELEVLE